MSVWSKCLSGGEVMDHEMIKRVAMTLSPQSWASFGIKCDTRAKKRRREASLDYAKRVIHVMKEPTEKMLFAGQEWGTTGDPFGIRGWRLHIEEILKND